MCSTCKKEASMTERLEPTASIDLNHAIFEIWWPTHVRTVFKSDGRTVEAAPNPGENFIQTAIHEFLHSIVAEAENDEPSVVLRAVADGDGRRWTPERRAEEGLAYSMGNRLAQLYTALLELGNSPSP